MHVTLDCSSIFIVLITVLRVLKKEKFKKHETNQHLNIFNTVRINRTDQSENSAVRRRSFVPVVLRVNSRTAHTTRNGHLDVIQVCRYGYRRFPDQKITFLPWWNVCMFYIFIKIARSELWAPLSLYRSSSGHLASSGVSRTIKHPCHITQHHTYSRHTKTPRQIGSQLQNILLITYNSMCSEQLKQLWLKSACEQLNHEKNFSDCNSKWC